MKQPETCEISQTAAGGKVDELAMLVRQLVQSLRKASPGNDLTDRALDYLKRHGLDGTFMRGNSTFVPENVPTQFKPSKASDGIGTSDSACRSESVPALQEALREAKYAISSMKTEAETAAQGDEQMMLEACEQISNEGLEASLAIDAVLGTWDMHQSQEPAPLQAVQPVKCETCNDHGMIGGPSFYDPGEGGQPYPDCEERHRNGLAAGDLMAWAAEVGGNRIAENVVEMTRDDLQRLIAERTPQTAPATVAVPDERAAFDEFFRKRNGLHPDTDTAFRSDAAEPWRYWQARAVLAATSAAAPDMVSVKQVDANKYCQILAALGMEEEGDPVAEVQNLQALAVSSILLDVVPGSDGMGHEVYATSVEDVVEKLSDLGSRLEDYQLGIAVAPQALAGHRDVAFEAVRQKFCKLQRYSFFLDDKCNVRRTPDYCGNWVEFEAVHTLFEPAAVEAAVAAKATQGGD